MTEGTVRATHAYVGRKQHDAQAENLRRKPAVRCKDFYVGVFHSYQ